jgi:hypothetical protein
LQTLLSTLSGDVENLGANFENIDVAGVSGGLSATVGASNTGIFELTNTSSLTGATTAGSASITGVTVPNSYGAIIVQAPGFETVSSGATGVLAVFGDQSQVDFAGSGSGTVVAGGAGDFVGLGGNGPWTAYLTGNDSVAASSGTATVVTSGSDNIVGLYVGSTAVSLGGSGDLLENYNSGVTGNITVSGADDRVLVDGGSDTVTAVNGSSGLNIFFNLSGGSLDFINNSSTSATVSGAVSGAIGGSVTAFGGAGGGVYIGGPGGNNSLVGGAGLVSLYGSGTNNMLSVSGAGDAGNLLSVGNAGTSSLVASASTTNNTFYGGASGSTTMMSSGSGTQTFFVGTGDQENLTGSTTSGAVNDYYFLQGTSGSGDDVITNFNLSTDKIFIDTIGPNQGQVSVSNIQANGGSAGGSVIYLTDNTSITLYGVSTTQLSNMGIKSGSTTI